MVAALPQQRCVLKTDVRSYSASIDHQLLLDRLAVHIADQQALNRIAQYLRRCVAWGGLSWDHRQSITSGSPLRSMLGAFFLTKVDDVATCGQAGVWPSRAAF